MAFATNQPKKWINIQAAPRGKKYILSDEGLSNLFDVLDDVLIETLDRERYHEGILYDFQFDQNNKFEIASYETKAKQTLTLLLEQSDVELIDDQSDVDDANDVAALDEFDQEKRERAIKSGVDHFGMRFKHACEKNTISVYAALECDEIQDALIAKDFVAIEKALVEQF